MPADPRPRTATRPDGTQDKELEARFEQIFRTLRGVKSPRPTDAASALTFVQELWDRLNSN